MAGDPAAVRRHSLRHSQLIDYPNVAAGHDGVLASQSGDLIVKPCKDEEIQFYQKTWKGDPGQDDFAYYMPKFYGTLSLQEHPPSSPSLPSAALATAAAAVTASNSAGASASTVSPPTPVSPPLNSPTLTSPRTDRRASHVSTLSTPGTPRSSASRGAHGRSPSRTSIISHLPVDESLAPTKPPKSWEPTHGAKIDTDTAIVLEDVAAGLAKPNIMDIKIGARLWADDAHPAKRQKLDKVAKETTSGSLGFRIAGMKLWAGKGAFERENREAMDRKGADAARDGSVGGGEAAGTSGRDATEASVRRDQHGLPLPSIRSDNYASYDREYGRALTTENVRLGFDEFFLRPQARIRPAYSREVISRFAEDLRGLIVAMENMEMRMYSASLLFVYEGDGDALKEDFKRENRMLREARLRHEAMERALQGIALQPNEEMVGEIDVEGLSAAATDSSTPIVTLTQPMPAVVAGGSSAMPGVAMPGAANPAVAAGFPSLPEISVGSSSLEMPARLILPDEQVERGSGSEAGGNAGQANQQVIPYDPNNDDDGDDDDDDDEEGDDENLLPKIQAMKVIDFAHATFVPGQGRDENFLHGVRSVLRILEEMVGELDGD